MGIKESIEIPFGAFDSELKGWEYTIPEGMKAKIEDNKVIIEPKESEDERMKKAIIATIHLYYGEPLEDETKEMVAWLEKQGKQNTNIHLPSFDEAQGTPTIEEGSQNLANSAKTCKVEPKFKDGQWIVWKDKCYKVNYNGCGYELVDQNGLSTSLEYGTIDENAHLWDITKDAKDGDVLVAKGEYFKEYIFIYSKMTDDDVISTHCGYDVIRNASNKTMSRFGRVEDFHSVCPATKEQRDLLFKKMKDAGYEWYDEKRELKKIEQNPAWSEEDEIGFGDAMWAIEQARTITKDENDMGNLWYAERWLKSIKERYTWKPSDEQINALSAINVTGGVSYAGQGQELINLYNDLKKLKEE